MCFKIHDKKWYPDILMFPSILLRVLTFYEVKFSLKGIMAINVGICYEHFYFHCVAWSWTRTAVIHEECVTLNDAWLSSDYFLCFSVVLS